MKRLILLSLILAMQAAAMAEALRIPAFTAYTEPDANGARISEQSGLKGWKNPNLKVLWFGEMRSPGALDASVALRPPSNAVSKLRLTVAGQARELEVKGAGTNVVMAHFGL